MACIGHSLLFMAEYSALWIVHVLFVHSSVGGHLDCFYFMTVMNNATVNISACLYNHCFLFGIYLGIEFQGYMVILLTDKLFSKVIMLFTFSPVMYEGHHFFSALSNTGLLWGHTILGI